MCSSDLSTKTIVHYASGSVYRAISAEAGTKHGLNPSVVIFDELAQAKNRDLYDALDTAMGASSNREELQEMINRGVGVVAVAGLRRPGGATQVAIGR